MGALAPTMPPGCARPRAQHQRVGTRSTASLVSTCFGARWKASLPALVLLLAGLWGCCTGPALAPVNLQQPGWTEHQGQAVWHLPQGKPEIAGDVLVATGPNGQSFVQFSKGPLPLIVAQAAPGRWQVELPPQNKRYSGHGSPPKRLLWLYLARALAGHKLPRHWTWHQDASGWRLANPDSGEFLQGYFNNQ